MNSPTQSEKDHYNEEIEDSDNWITQNIRVTWSGLYLHEGRKRNLLFENLQVEQGGSITGSGCDDEGDFFIEGHIWKPNIVRLVKQYWSQNSVQLTGTITGGFIEGQWSKSHHENGKFFAEVEGLDKWFGLIRDKQGAPLHSFIVDMVVCIHGIYGMGSDNLGEYVIKGEQDQSKVRFVKSYHFERDIYFVGKIIKEEPDRVIRGNWGYIDDIQGTFEMAGMPSRERRKTPDASDIMRKFQELAMGGPISPHHRDQISQERLVGYTGPMTDPKEYVTVARNMWVVHPGKCRFDHVVQNGQGSLKGALINLNIPDKPAWGNEEEIHEENHFAADMSPTYKPQNGINIRRLYYTPNVTSNKYLNIYDQSDLPHTKPDYGIASFNPQIDPLRNHPHSTTVSGDMPKSSNNWLKALASSESDKLPKIFGQYLSSLTGQENFDKRDSFRETEANGARHRSKYGLQMASQWDQGTSSGPTRG